MILNSKKQGRMRYHIVKQSRAWSGRGYKGPSSNYETQEYNDVDTARGVIKYILSIQNPVGWDIIDSTTGEIVPSYEDRLGEDEDE